MASALQHHTSVRQQPFNLTTPYNPSASTAACSLYDLGQDPKMSQALLHRQYQPVQYPQDSGWQQQQYQYQQQRQHQHQQQLSQYQQHQRIPCLSATTNTSSTSSSQDQYWGNPSTIENSLEWDNGLPTDPFAAPKSESSNSNLVYTCTAAQGGWNNTEIGFGNESSWPSSCVSAFPGEDHVNNPNMGMAMTPSQGSAFHEVTDYKPYAVSPGMSAGHESPETDWSTIGSAFSPTTEGTSPGSMSSVPMLVSTRSISSSDLSTNSFNSPPQGYTVRTPALTGSPTAFRQPDSAAFTFNGAHNCDSTQFSSQTSSPNAAQWLASGYSGLPRTPQCIPPGSYTQTTMLKVDDSDQKVQRQLWSGIKTETTEWHQNESPTRQNTDPDVKRKQDDEILMECKAKGITYKEIKKRLRTNVAESTLRGRYRALTKARKDRVRKPVWTEKDVTLLEDFVQQELSRIGRRDPSLNRSARLAKIQWTKVVEHIEEHGSYRFGVATAKKKYVETTNGH